MINVELNIFIRYQKKKKFHLSSFLVSKWKTEYIESKTVKSKMVTNYSNDNVKKKTEWKIRNHSYRI